MNISINPSYFRGMRNGTDRSFDECIKLCYDAGFRVFDVSVDAWGIWNKNLEGQIETFMNAAAKYNVTIEQSHAPYNFYTRASSEDFAKALDKSVDAAIRMGVKNLVFHADEYYPAADEPWDSNVGLIKVYDCLAPHIEKLTKGGVRAAIETIFEDRTLKPKEGRRMHYCADIEEVIAVIDRFNDKMVGCCWDFGHAKLAVGNENHVEAIQRVGSRIICTHVHDNYYSDTHTQPFLGNANWEQLMPALKETGYSGSLTFEMNYGYMHDELITGWVSQLYQTGEILARMFEGKDFGNGK